MNIAIGQAGIVLGLAASVFGAVALVVGLVQKRPVVRRTASWYAVMALVGALLGRKTKMIKPRKWGKFTVTLLTRGRFPFQSTLDKGRPGFKGYYEVY